MSEAVAITERQKKAPEWELTHPPESLWQDAWRRLLRNRAAVVSGIFLIIVIVFAIFADDGIISWALGRESRPLLAPYDYQKADFHNTRAAPSKHPLINRYLSIMSYSMSPKRLRRFW